MTRARFLWAKLTRDETSLARLGLPFDRLIAGLEGKAVALVGNARSLAGTTHGAAIDAADIVIRLNAAPMPDARSHGTRTDWMAMSIPVPPAVIAARAPARIVWMTPRRKRLRWALATDPRFALLPADRAARLAAVLGARPSTGALATDLCIFAQCTKIDLYGFDFFASKSLTGRRAAADVAHDFAAEAALVRAQAARDPRLTLHP